MQTPTTEYRRTDFGKPKELFKGLDAAVYALIGLYQRRQTVAAGLLRVAERIDALAACYKDMSDHQLQQRLFEFREKFRRGLRGDQEVMQHSLAAIREAADRQIGLRPYVVQLMGALALYRGCLVEMATGEGKTLTACLTAVLWGWSCKPCHVITVNDYLVQRDAEWLRPLYRFCGVRVGTVTAFMAPEERKKNYDCDVTYATSKEVVADFLRDCLKVITMRNQTRRLIRSLLSSSASQPAARLVMRGLHSAIVDEADSVLIDEAVTPLIIASPRPNDTLREAVLKARDIGMLFDPSVDYTVNLRYKEVELTPAGRAKLEKLCGQLPGIWRGPLRRSELVKQAITAREFYHLGKQYVVAEGKVVIVDEFTGRQMPHRTWREGMHQAIEAKEGLPITDPSETIARISFQRYFRLYRRLAGMTGTASEAAGEFWQIYGLPVIRIPTNRPCIRLIYPDQVFPTEQEKWHAVVEEIVRLHKTGRPVLVGTRSVVASELLAERLAARGLDFKVLNAVRHHEEALVVALAGEPGRITIATNMAGRGTDIKLGAGVAAMGGLHVIATERHESSRVDRQLFGRCARQGDPGSAQTFVSIEDELIRRYLPTPMQRQLATVVRARLPGADKLARFAFAHAQRTAQNIAFKMRKNVLRMDDWLDESLSFAGSETGP